MEDNLTVHQICKAANVTRTQLNQWIVRGYLTPAETPENGKARSFTFKDAMSLAVFAELTRLGLPYDRSVYYYSTFLHGFKNDEAILVIYHGPIELIPSSERGSNAPKKKGLKFYDPDNPSVSCKIVKKRDLLDFISNPDVSSTLSVNLDTIEKRVLAALEDGSADE